MNLLAELTEAWRERAACRMVGNEIFFGTQNESDYAVARKLCGSCPVRTQCLDFALRCEPVVHGHRIGFWAGMLPKERSRMAASLGRLRVCSECYTPFSTRTSNALVCSPTCRRHRINRLARTRAKEEMAS